MARHIESSGWNINQDITPGGKQSDNGTNVPNEHSTMQKSASRS